jgi:transposase
MSTPRTRPKLFDRFPGLEQLFTGYVADHWDYTFDSLESAVERFATMPDPTLKSAVDGLTVLLQLPVGDPDRRAALAKSTLDDSAAPSPEDELFLEWMYQHLSHALAKR